MKKHIKIGKSYTPIRDAKFEAIQKALIEQQKRLDEMIRKLREE